MLNEFDISPDILNVELCKNGVRLCFISGNRKNIEKLCASLRNETGIIVDWCYFQDRPTIYTMPKQKEMVLQKIKELLAVKNNFKEVEFIK